MVGKGGEEREGKGKIKAKREGKIKAKRSAQHYRLSLGVQSRYRGCTGCRETPSEPQGGSGVTVP